METTVEQITNDGNGKEQNANQQIIYFILTMHVLDKKNNIYQGNLYYDSHTGKLTKEDVDLAKKQYCDSISEQVPGVIIDPLRCVCFGIFELDA